MTQTDTKTWNLAKIDEISKFDKKWRHFKIWLKMKKFQNLTENEEISYQKWWNFKIWPKMKKFQNLTENEEISKFEDI